MSPVECIIMLIFLAIVEMCYIKVARRLKIGSSPSARSSHTDYMITGGGIVYYVALVAYFVYHGSAPSNVTLLMLLGTTALAVISFLDDIFDLPAAFRLLVQVAVVSLAFSFLITAQTFNMFLLILICGVGFINAYNFMDGINGMMAGYTLVTLLTMLYCFYQVPGSETEQGVIYAMLIATVVFAFFNWRAKAICFSGDVGSIVVGFAVMCLFYKLLAGGYDPSILVFLIVYAVDAVFTIVQRLFKGENIMKPHRRHLYQVLANQWHIPHFKVAMYYSLTQLAINCLYFVVPQNFRWSYALIITGVLTTIYFTIKRSTRSTEE